MTRIRKINSASLSATSRSRSASASAFCAAAALAGMLMLLVGCSAGTSGLVSSTDHTRASAKAPAANSGVSQAKAGIPGPQSAGAQSAGPNTALNTSAAPTASSSTPNEALKQQKDGAAVCASTPAVSKRIYVSISLQHLWACAGTSLFLDTAVTTGASALTNVHDATPTGTMHVNGKVRNTVLAGHDVNGSWHDAVSYWMPFSGGDGFHDASWQTFPLGSQLYTSQGSHGCVHVALSSLATLFDWTPVGTPVIIRD